MLNGIVSLAIAREVASAQLSAQKTADEYYRSNANYTISYDITTRGTVKGDIEEFRRIVADIYADERGWIRAGVKMVEVESGAQAHVILASGEEVKNASPTICSDKLSCQVGQLILINDDRWMNASDSYNALGVSLLDYRRMVVNHETGHYLGHPHIPVCEIPNGLGPIMLQQSTGLRGCRPNPWPLPSELWVRR
ncbi:DUF3152 domain-containing protein [Candidatus Saccharibacteria bacterium]|jgi:hypothetical protein|nr:DUF3152 domain-containing protein [Candidatus Saccharibacteria bacterium]